MECPVDPYEIQLIEELESVFDPLEKCQDRELLNTHRLMLCSVSMTGIPGPNAKDGGITGFEMNRPDVDWISGKSIQFIKSDDISADMERDFADEVSTVFSESGMVKTSDSDAETNENFVSYEDELSHPKDQVALSSTCPQDTTGTSGESCESHYLLKPPFNGQNNINSGSSFPDSSGGSQFASRDATTNRFMFFPTLKNTFRTSNQALSSCGYVTSGSENTTGCLTLTSFTDESGISLPVLCESTLSDNSSFINEMLISTDAPDLSQNEHSPMHEMDGELDNLPHIDTTECCSHQSMPFCESHTPSTRTSNNLLKDMTSCEEDDHENTANSDAQSYRNKSIHSTHQHVPDSEEIFSSEGYVVDSACFSHDSNWHSVTDLHEQDSSR